MLEALIIIMIFFVGFMYGCVVLKMNFTFETFNGKLLEIAL